VSTIQPTRQNNPTATIKKGTYFASGIRLYCLMDIMPDKDFYLVEDCFTNDSCWWPEKVYKKTQKTIVNAKST
jgi:hypothetical protein